MAPKYGLFWLVFKELQFTNSLNVFEQIELLWSLQWFSWSFPRSFFFIYFACSHCNHAKVDNLLVSTSDSAPKSNIELSNLDDGIEKFAQFEVSTQPLLYWVDCVVISCLWVSAWGARQIFCWNDHYAILLLKITSNQTNVLTWATFQFTWFPFITFGFVEHYRSISNVFWFVFLLLRNVLEIAQLLR